MKQILLVLAIFSASMTMAMSDNEDEKEQRNLRTTRLMNAGFSLSQYDDPYRQQQREIENQKKKQNEKEQLEKNAPILENGLKKLQANMEEENNSYKNQLASFVASKTEKVAKLLFDKFKIQDDVTTSIE